MTRNLTSTLKTELNNYNLKPIHLIEFNFDTPLYFTDNAFELTSSISGVSRTYTPSSFVKGVSQFNEEVGISKSSLRIGLSGVDQSFISIALGQNITNVVVSIYRGFLDSNNAIISDPFLLYNGKIDQFEINESKENSEIIFTIASHWADFEKVSGRKTNPTSQKRFFSSDKGMEFSSETVQDIKWGRA